MKKLIVMLAIVVAGATAAKAQAPVLQTGDMIGQVGLNFVSGNAFGVNASLEIGLNDNLFGQSWLGWGWGGSVDAYFFDGGFQLAPAVRTALHLQLPVKGLDIYLGVGLGLGITFADPMDLRFFWNSFVGVRYFFTDTIGIYAEGGFGANDGGGTLGVTFRF